MRKSLLQLASLILLFSTAAMAQDTFPTSRAATLPPDRLYVAFFTAMTQSHWDDCLALTADDPRVGALARTMVDYARQSRQLHTNAVAQFGETDSQQVPDAATQLIELAAKSTLTTTGEDRASLVLNDNPWLAMRLIDGAWRITDIHLGARAPSAATNPSDDEPALIARFASAIHATAGNVKAGKYVSIEEMMKDYDSKLDAAAMPKAP